MTMYLILPVMAWSEAVLFHRAMMSSVGLIEITAPQISLPTINCSPRMASSCEIIDFYYNIYHLDSRLNLINAKEWQLVNSKQQPIVQIKELLYNTVGWPRSAGTIGIPSLILTKSKLIMFSYSDKQIKVIFFINSPSFPSTLRRCPFSVEPSIYHHSY